MSPILGVLGVVWAGLGLFMVVARERIVARHVRRRGRAAVPAMGWAVLGVTLGVVGAVQVALALA